MPKFKPYPDESPTEALERISKNIENEGLPTTNAPDRVETYQLGGMIKPPTAPSMQPPTEPGLQPPVPGGYKEGGKVKPYSVAEKTPKSPDVTDIVKEVRGAEKELSNIKTRNRGKKLIGFSADRIEAVKESKKKKTKKMVKKILKKKEGGKVGSPKKKYTIKTKTAGFDKAEKEHKAREKAEKGMTFDQKIAAAKARKAKTDTTKSKSAYQLAKEAAARHKARLAKKGKK